MRLFTQDDSLVVEFHGFEVLWAFKKRIIIPFTNLSSLEFHESWQWPVDGIPLRVGGTFVPRTLMAGRYQAAGDQYFAYLRGVSRTEGAYEAVGVAVITTHDYPYAQLFISVESAEQIPKV